MEKFSITTGPTATLRVRVPQGVSYYLALSGTFGGGTLKAQYSTDFGVFVDYPTALQATAPAILSGVNVGFSDEIQLSLSGALSPSITVVSNHARVAEWEM